MFPPQTDNFQKPIKCKSVLGNEFFGKKGEKRVRRNRVRRNQSPKRTQNQNRKPSIVSIVEGMGTLLSFASGGSVRRG
jgi:DNA polymerase/3'-5' exonuclease PolX